MQFPLMTLHSLILDHLVMKDLRRKIDDGVDVRASL
jgi:hypothetical protein